MKNIVLLFILLSTSIAQAQTSYESAMNEALSFMSTGLQKASQRLERIALVEKEKYLPAYYVALCNINSTWDITDKKLKYSHITKAQEYIDTAMDLSPDNVELIVLQGMINICWINYEPKTYAMKLSGETTALYEKAYKIAPDNPRVILGRADWLMGSARYFGKDTSVFCKMYEDAVRLFNTTTTTGLEPSWGKKRALEKTKECE